MSAEWITVAIALVAVGVTVTVAVVSGFRRLDDRLRAVETRLDERLRPRHPPELLDRVAGRNVSAAPGYRLLR